MAGVEAAARRIEGVATRTPVLRGRTLDELARAEVFLKAEHLQRTGAFKFRGAFNKLSTLAPDVRARGVTAFSSGNHAAAVALAARLFDTTAVILMPDDSPPAKVDATRGYGAEIVIFDRYRDDREVLGRQLAEERGLTLVPPFDDWDVMAGQGTVALELFDEVPDLDVLVVPVGGGGLMAGCATVARARRGPAVRIVGVEPERGDDTRQSLARRERVSIAVPYTIADGQQITTPGRLTFEVNRRLVDEVVLVSDAQILDAMVFCFDRLKQVTEPSGASALAAVLAGVVAHPVTNGRRPRMGVVLSGGNVGVARFAALTRRAQASG